MNNSLNATTQRKVTEGAKVDQGSGIKGSGAKVEADRMKITLVSYLMKIPWTFGNHFQVDS